MRLRRLPLVRGFGRGWWPAPCVVGARAAFALAVVCVGCAPALNWREVRLEGGDIRASFPCRPDTFERQVLVGGRSHALRMATCAAEGWSFAITQVDVGDPARVNPMIEDLRRASEAKLALLHQAAVAASGWRWPGATPYDGAGRWVWRGQGSDGQPLELDVGIAAYGTVVVQAMVVGAQPAGLQAAPFWDGLGRRLP